MSERRKRWWVAVLSGSAVLVTASAVAQERSRGPGSTSAPVQRGEYLTTIAGCNDCHTPMKMGKQGPEPDLARRFSGHPAELKMPPPPQPNGPWGLSGAMTLTAWNSPAGTVYSANLTPDKETGIGNWTQKQFLDTLRNGRHLGAGRQLLPPMPWMWIGKATDEDLGAIFAYLQTVKPIRNRVPDPVPTASAPPATP